jgi:KinB signaling pathway activation protein
MGEMSLNYECVSWLFWLIVGTINYWSDQEEESFLTFVNWLKMFGMTLAIGTVVSVVIGLIVQIADPELTLFNYSIVVFVISGLLYGTLSQLGFFAYMTLNYIALDMFRQRKIWLYIQWFLIILAFLYLVFLRAMSFDQLSRWHMYLILPALLFAASWGVAQWKVKLTNPTAFTPTLFFMAVVTALEAIPALRENDPLASAGMLIPLFACNAWQIVNLHKYVRPRKAGGGAGEAGTNGPTDRSNDAQSRVEAAIASVGSAPAHANAGNKNAASRHGGTAAKTSKHRKKRR